ncbi:MAG: ornithine carbamoyltransferase [Clostridiales bacterium]|jgi:ornithine carbamoyltransferase|nr:ornithine carbamoyltransferase [Clostridiales bacterium]
MKHFISLNDISEGELRELLDLAQRLKAERKEGRPHPLLKGKTLGMIFTKSSTRTRVSFEAGMYQLGGYPLVMNAGDLQLGRGEPIGDTARVLSRYIDAIMIRTYSQSDVEGLASHGSIPVINGLTDEMHPCQALADLMTLREAKGTLKGVKLAYVGDGNNVAHSLLHACALAGTDIAVATPAAFACKRQYVDEAMAIASRTGAGITITDDPAEAVARADAVYTDTWVSMGMEEEKAERAKAFKGYQVDGKLFALAKPDAIFMHCLPVYRGFEASDDIVDGPASRIFDEAENRLHAQKAVLVKLLGGSGAQCQA